MDMSWGFAAGPLLVSMSVVLRLRSLHQRQASPVDLLDMKIFRWPNVLKTSGVETSNMCSNKLYK
jgi:hypothetical protein